MKINKKVFNSTQENNLHISEVANAFTVTLHHADSVT
jgi:hypothetical protein